MNDIVPILKQHVVHLLDEFQLDHFYCATDDAGTADVDGWYVSFPYINNEIAYQTALHEIGHFGSFYEEYETPYQILKSEYLAWDWAHKHSLLWNKQMNIEMQECLYSYWEDYRPKINRLFPWNRVLLKAYEEALSDGFPRFSFRNTEQGFRFIDVPRITGTSQIFV